jgi:hypothetical protein
MEKHTLEFASVLKHKGVGKYHSRTGHQDPDGE